ncbi:cation:proton antiporter [Motilimonas sp. KMU-193]|uniref:cation:proton antiporter domain-containing protein n=1 Tax=Motilimonas sp. KMU-193 TaxID=3388668 RepID=UPI00396B0928
MELSSVLIAIIAFLAVAVVCISIFEKLGFGAILGFIITGVILGPNTPGLVPIEGVDELQSISELGVVLFMFTVGLEMQPQKVWSMRRLIFGLGSAQMIVTAACLATLFIFLYGLNWESSIIISLALAMSSTAIVMATLGERGEVNTEHGKTTFSVLMAQDLWIVPVMALVPILAHNRD